MGKSYAKGRGQLTSTYTSYKFLIESDSRWIEMRFEVNRKINENPPVNSNTLEIPNLEENEQLQQVREATSKQAVTKSINIFHDADDALQAFADQEGEPITIDV